MTKIKLLGLLALVLTFSFYIAGCEEEPEEEPEVDPTVITITGYNGGNGDYLLRIYNNILTDTDAVAMATGAVSGNSFVATLKKDGRNWAGTGNYHIEIDVDYGNGWAAGDIWVYTNGGTDKDRPERCSITKLQETIAFSKFLKIPK